MSGNFKIEWVDHGREPQCQPDPAYPKGIDVELYRKLDAPTCRAPTCRTGLPYPARRCGHYHVKCNICGFTVAITTAGRPDDPRSVLIPCKLKGRKQ